MSNVTLIIVIVAVVSVVVILGARAGRERGTKIERRPPSDEPKDFD